MNSKRRIVSTVPPRHPPLTLAGLLDGPMRDFAGRPAILAPDRPALTYARLGRQLDDTARALAGFGYGPRARIAVALPAGPEFAVAVIAVARCATCAPLNRTLDEASIAELLAAMRIEALVAAAGDSAMTAAARRASVPLLRLHALAQDGAGAFALDAEEPSEPSEPALPSLDDIALLGHTSGTTSRPKIVPQEQWRLTEAVRNRALLLDGDDERSLLLSPLSSLGSIRRSLLPPLLAGGSVVCPSALDGRSLVDVLATLQPTQLVASPTVLRSMLEEFERRQPRPTHGLRVMRATYAGLAADLQHRLEAEFKVPVVVSYGMTETGNIAEVPQPPARAPDGSVGRPATAVEVVVTDDVGRALGCGEAGEIVVRGAEVFAGYEDDEEANRLAFRDGWFRTGDVGRFDRDGFLYLAGRLKDIINRGGTKVAPVDVESVLARHPAVREVAVFAVPHPTLGEDIAAAVVLREGASAGEADLRRFARGALPPFRVPARFLLLPELPRGALDKVRRDELAALAQQAATANFEPPCDELEAQLVAIFAEVLDQPRIGRHDGFFELGGDSLRGMRVISRLEEDLGFAVALDLLYDHPSAAALAMQLRGRSAGLKVGVAASSSGSAAPESPR